MYNYKHFESLMDELLYMGWNPTDLPTVVHYQNRFGKFKLHYYHYWLSQNPNPKSREFQTEVGHP
jgi:hypothetical protein